MAILTSEVRMAVGTPDRMVMLDRKLSAEEAGWTAQNAVYTARLLVPRVTGRTASRLQPLAGEGWFGIYFPDVTTWFQERGTRAFTMRSLAGKTIPMWVEDKDGSERRKNPKAKVRQTEDGRTQILIFRKAARQGQQRTRVMPDGRITSSPMSYPGAPGRISSRRASGQIGQGNVGVRWRHPGLQATGFINQAVTEAALVAGLDIDTVYVLDGASWESILANNMKGLI